MGFICFYVNFLKMTVKSVSLYHIKKTKHQNMAVIPEKKE